MQSPTPPSRYITYSRRSLLRDDQLHVEFVSQNVSPSGDDRYTNSGRFNLTIAE